MRYTYGDPSGWVPFVETGGWVSPNVSMTFTRTYENGAGFATGVGKTSGDIGYAFGRAGIAVDWAKANQLAVSAEFGEEWLRVKGYTEPMTPANPFEAQVSSGADTMTLAKLKAQYTLGLTSKIDGTLYVAGVRSLSETSTMQATVDGLGTFFPVLHPGAM